MLKRIQKFLEWLGGADQSVLKKVPSEGQRIVQMALVLLTTASIAAMSATFALHDGVKAPWPWAVIIGIFWGGVILNFDRFLVLSMGSTRDRRRLLALALPRFAMAVLLAAVISTPLVLRIFARDIAREAFQLQQARSAQIGQLEKHSSEQLQANKLQQQIAAQQAILAGHLPLTVTNPQLQTAQANVTSLTTQQANEQQTVIKAREAWQCELYGMGVGCVGASNRPGQGPIANAKEAQYRADLADLHSIERQLQAAKSRLATVQKTVASTQKTDLAKYQKAARAALPGLERHYSALEAYLRNEAKQGTQLNNGDTGLLTQIQALFDIGNQDPALAVAHWAVFLLFFTIEVLPVGVKVLLNLGPMSAYEVAAQLRDEQLIDRVKTKRIEARRIKEGKSQVRINLEDDMRKHEEVLGKQANMHVANEMTTILNLALQDWSAKVQARLKSGTATQAPPPGGPSPGAPPGGPGPGAPTGGPGSGAPTGGPGSGNNQGHPVGPFKVLIKKLFRLPDPANLGP